jgi:hypothetical protein
MNHKLRSHLTFANVTSLLALFLVLSGGTAVALNGGNTVFTDDIANDTQPAGGGNPAGGLQAADLRPNSVGSSEAANNSLTGADVNEGSLGQVPSALLGGFGRSTGDGSCNPESAQFFVCAVVTRNLPAQARLLLIAEARAQTENQATGGAAGTCRIGTTAGPLLDTETIVSATQGDWDHVTLTAVTEPFPPGQHSFGMDCNDSFASNMEYRDAGITAVAISPD